MGQTCRTKIQRSRSPGPGRLAASGVPIFRAWDWWHRWDFKKNIPPEIYVPYMFHMAVCQNLVPLVNIKIAGKWMFIPLKMVCIGIDP